MEQKDDAHIRTVVLKLNGHKNSIKRLRNNVMCA